MERPPALDDPEYAAFAWARFRRILKWMALVAFAVAAGTMLLFWATIEEFNVHVAIATFAGIFLTMLLAAVLMGLMFLSSGTGHDEQVEDRISDEIDIGD